MAKEIKMPQLSDTMDSGKILNWSKSEGDTIERGDILAEVETDKANLEIESFDKGVLLKIVVPVNETANVGEIIAYIGEAGEAVSASEETEAPKTPEVSTPLAITQPVETPVATTPAPETSHATTTETTDERIKVSPLAKKIAAQKNINLSGITGSGPQGRIIKKDVENAGEGTQLAPPATTTPAPATSSSGSSAASASTQNAPTSNEASYTELSKMRTTIAQRMQQAVQEVPHFYTTVSINMSQAKKLRAACKANDDYKSISINHLIMKASAYALSQVPRVNCSFKEQKLYNPGAINIGIITAVEDGLLIPVIKDVDRLNLKDLAFETRAAVDRARAGRPNAADLSGGTFSISNMGMFDVENFTAIINPGQGAILAVSSVKDTPIAEDGQICIAPIMKVTLSVDHRIIDGAVSSAFLQEFKAALEQPALMLI